MSKLLFAVLVMVFLAGCAAPTTETDIQLLSDRGFTEITGWNPGAGYERDFYAYAGKCRVHITKGRKDGRLYAPLDPASENSSAHLTDPTVDDLRKVPAYAACFN